MYDHKKTEEKWQKKWAKDRVFEVDLKRAKKPFYNLMMFPYPSGEGLHAGHVFTFGGADTYGRLKRLQGFDVFEPMGFDAFGIHSENYAIKVGQHPRKLIAQTVEYFREKQLKKLGALFDWRYEVNTTDPSYYKWTQWLFLQLYKADLAERKKSPVNFCPSCKTVLADEQVILGKCERCDSIVEQKELEQWFFKITKYADRLLKNLDWIDWSETTKTLQRNWIGRSEGVAIKFPIATNDKRQTTNDFIEVFTTRPDTIYGATFVVLAPENPLVLKLTKKERQKEVGTYLEKAKKEKLTQRVGTGTKTGVFLGSHCLNPLTKKEIPIWISGYVSMEYGTGAIMGVPAHDQRDFEFAKKYKLEIKEVISPTRKPQGVLKVSCEDYGILLNSGPYSGMKSEDAIKKLSNYIENNNLGSKTVNFHLRDWLISRQRYWGPPIPIIYCDKCGTVPVPEKDLPVHLPDLVDFQPKGKGLSPLATLEDWVKVKCPTCGGSARRETDVSDTFLDSSWYFLRYPSTRSAPRPELGTKARSGQVPFDPALTKKWLPVDSYIGGNEHATLHLLYVRFITMVLRDLGFVEFEEPFKKFRAHGLIIHEGAKMSKSRGNVVNPNEYIEKYGADALRMYLLFIGPYEAGGDFSDLGIAGVYRFVNRVYSLFETKIGKRELQEEDRRVMHKTIKRVGEDIENLRFNTAIAALMEYVNYLAKKQKVSKQEAEVLSLILAPLAPHLAEELWEINGNRRLAGSVHNQKWPSFEQKYLQEEKLTIVVQVNGKLRDKLLVKSGTAEEKVRHLAVNSPKVLKYVGEKEVKKIFLVPNRLVNIVTN